MKVKCVTNLDDYTCPVKAVVCRPILDDYVCVIYKGNTIRSLKIVRITHVDPHTEAPYLLLELNK